MVQFVGEDEGDIPEGDSDDEPSTHLTLRKRKVRVIDDFREQTLPATTSKDTSMISTSDAPQASSDIIIALSSSIPPTTLL